MMGKKTIAKKITSRSLYRVQASFFCILGLVFFFHPTFLSGFTQMQLDAGDTWFNNYLIENAYSWITGRISWSEFWSPNYFYPMPNVTAYSDILVSTAPLYAPFRWMGFLPDTAFQLWMILVSIVNFWVAHLFLNRGLKASHLAACFGAFLFAFGAPRLSQLGHQQLLPQFFTLLGLWSLAELVRGLKESQKGGRKNSKWICIFWGSVVGQFYTGFYLAWMYFTLLEFYIMACLLFKPTRSELFLFVKRLGLQMAAGGVIAALLLWPMLNHYIEVTQEVGFRSFEEAKWMIPTIQSWFYQGDRVWIHWWMSKAKLWRDISMGHEHHMGVGWATSLGIGWIFYRLRHQKWIKPMLVAMIVFYLLLTQIPGGATFWKWGFDFVPGAKAIRAISRVCLMYLVPLTIGFAFLIQHLQKNFKRYTPVLKYSLVALCALMLLEQGQTTGTFEKSDPRGRVERITSELRYQNESRVRDGRQPCNYFYFSHESPRGKDWWPWVSHLAAMWVARQEGIATVNGYSGNFPQNWYQHFFYNGITDESDFKKQQAGIVEWMQLRKLDSAGLCWVKAE